MDMLKRWLMLLPVLLSLAAPGLAEVYTGTTAALSTVTVRTEDAGTIGSAEAVAGKRVEAGQPLYRMKAQRTFASQDGDVSLISADVGDAVSGEVLELAPTQRYTIHCTVDSAYKSAAAKLVHSGETVYAKCTRDGTHRAVGTVTEIDGTEYRVMTLGGELYVGETVYLYRDDAFTAAQRVGIGTVVVSDTETYEAEGRLTDLRVAEGDWVERGQLLYATGGGEIAAPVSGIVVSLSCQAGDAIEADQAVAEIVPADAVGVEAQVDETDAARIAVGDRVALTFAGREDEDATPGTVVGISYVAESDRYTVVIRPETDAALPLGMSVEVRV